MSVKDVIKNSVYEQFGTQGDFGPRKVLFLLIVSALIGLYMYAVYKNQSRSSFYSKDLNKTIAGLPLIVCAIMIAMQSNLIVSLGMVGALSIVRFRNAVKNPMDLLYFFWSISAGIICGVGLVLLAAFLCVAMTGMVLLLNVIPGAKASSVIVLRTSARDVDWAAVCDTIKKYGRNVREKSRNIQSGRTEVIYELIASDEENLIKELEQNAGIEQISFLSHDGEYRI